MSEELKDILKEALARKVLLFLSLTGGLPLEIASFSCLYDRIEGIILS
jgi:hypothetical protein